jgi:hypothetical protein
MAHKAQGRTTVVLPRDDSPARAAREAREARAQLPRLVRIICGLGSAS